MNKRLILFFALAAIASPLTLRWEEFLNPSVVSETLAQTQRPFLVFDATLYQHKPDMGRYGIKPLRVIYAGEFWDRGQDRATLPSEQLVRRLAETAGSRAVIDIEHWPTHAATQDIVQASVEKYLTLLRWFHEAAPNLNVGYYGVVPIRDYWRAVTAPTSVEHRAWMAENTLLLPIAKEVDALYPSLYTFYVDRAGWVRHAESNLREAKRLADGKPVYAFLWPQYHESNRLLRGKFLPADYWKLELQTVKQHADGIVLWGGWGNDGPAAWDEAAPWWTVTKEFLETF
jgi:hypothetical protein